MEIKLGKLDEMLEKYRTDDIEEDLSEPFANFVSSFTDSKKAINDILPPPASTPKKVNDSSFMPIKPTLEKYFFGEKNGEWIMQYIVRWPFYGQVYKTVTDEQMKSFAKGYIVSALNRADRHDDKYVEVIRADDRYVIYRFNIDKWMYDNFNYSLSTYTAPSYLSFPIKIPIPLFIYCNASSLFDLAHFIEKGFKEFMSTRPSKFKNNNWYFLKKIDGNMFDYKCDLQKGTITACLRSTVILGALAIYSAVMFHKKLTPQQLHTVQNSSSRFSNVDNLNTFLKKFK